MVLSPALTPRARKEVLAMRVVDIKEQLRARVRANAAAAAAIPWPRGVGALSASRRRGPHRRLARRGRREPSLGSTVSGAFF